MSKEADQTHVDCMYVMRCTQCAVVDIVTSRISQTAVYQLPPVLATHQNKSGRGTGDMAIPSLRNVTPTDEENWQRLERLLCELFLVLRALILPTGDAQPNMQGNNPPAPGGGQPPPPGGGRGPTPGPPGPGGTSRPVNTPRRRTPVVDPSETSKVSSSKHLTPLQTWHQVGTELRVIADTLTSRRHLVQLRHVSGPCSKGDKTSSAPSTSVTLNVSALNLLQTTCGD